MRRLSILTALVILSGCASLSTQVKIAEKKLPERFDAQTTGESLAKMNWREYFADENLNNLISEALKNNPDLMIALQRIEATRAGVKAATGALLPQVSLSLGAGVRKFGLYTMDGAGNATTEITPGNLVPVNLGDFSLGLVSSWEIDIWGKLRNERQSAISQYLATIEGSNAVLTTLISDVAMAYFELLANENQLLVLHRAVESSEQAVEVIKLQKDAGRANMVAVRQFEAQLSNVRALKVDAEMRAKELEGQLNVLLGRFPQDIVRKPDVLFVNSAHTFTAGLPAELLRNRPDIRAAELQVQSSKFDLKAARAAFFPNINISAGVGYQAFNPSFLFSTPASLVYSVLGGLTAPLLNHSGLSARFDGAKAAQIQAMYEYQKAVLNAYVEVSTGLAGIEKIEGFVAFKQSQRDALDQSVETANDLYKAGKATYLEVLIAQQNSLSVRLEAIEAVKRKKLLTVALYKALGGGWQ
jgi:outer membrane protein, multidrug efflux system